MKIYLTDQEHRLKEHLERLKKASVMHYDRSKLTEKVTSIDISRRRHGVMPDLAFLYSYHIFPPHIMSFRAQWIEEGRAMQPGDTIVQQVFIPPITGFSQKIVFGVRIREIIDSAGKKGFSYETLEGHVEKGISSFIFESSASGLVFTIHTYSAPGNLLAKLLGPFFSVPYQSFCTKAALHNVKRQIEMQ